MKRRKWRLGNHKALADFFEFASEQIKEKPIVVEITAEKRSLDQNAMIYAMYGEIAKQREDMTVRDVRHLCKLEIGVPILRAHDPDFCAFYDKGMKKTLNYEEKLEAMRFLPVTSLMNKKQGAEYITSMIRYWSQQGVYIQMPEDESRMREAA